MKEIFDFLREEIKSKKARTDNKCKELLESEGYSPDYRFFEGKSVGLRIATEQLDKAEAKWKEKKAELCANVIDEFAIRLKYEYGSDEIHETIDEIASQMKGEKE